MGVSLGTEEFEAKKKIKKMLNDLPFNDKKKLLDAVISPETGGCVYIRPLSALRTPA